jgi:hypothetical protein
MISNQNSKKTSNIFIPKRVEGTKKGIQYFQSFEYIEGLTTNIFENTVHNNDRRVDDVSIKADTCKKWVTYKIHSEALIISSKIRGKS